MSLPPPLDPPAGSGTPVGPTPAGSVRSPAASIAFAFWSVNVALHHGVQGLFVGLARSYGFDALQRVEALLFVPLLLVGVAWIGKECGWRIAGIVLVANVLAAASFVTRAEALHLVQYGLVFLFWTRALRPRQAFYLTVLLGIVDETLQWAWLDTERSAAFVDLKDCGLNLVGALNGWAADWAWRGRVAK